MKKKKKKKPKKSWWQRRVLFKLCLSDFGRKKPTAINVIGRVNWRDNEIRF